MSTELIELVQRLGQPRVLVVGDLMLDRYIWGDAERISQEAPVILLRADRREERLGGASSVATMLQALGARVVPGRRRRRRCRRRPHPQMLSDLGIDHDGVVTDAEPAQHGQGTLHRPGPASPSAADDPRRLRGSPGRRRHDRPGPGRRHRPATAQVRHRADQRLRQGRLHAGRAWREVISEARKAGLQDRGRPDPRQRLSQVSRLLGHHAQPPRSGPGHRPRPRFAAANRRGRRASFRNSSIWKRPSSRSTRTACASSTATAGLQMFPTRPRQVYDITGAGDMVMSVLGMALAGGAELRRGHQPGQHRRRPGGREDRRGHGDARGDPARSAAKPFEPGQLRTGQDRLRGNADRASSNARRKLGQRIVFTNGCFDVAPRRPRAVSARRPPPGRRAGRRPQQRCQRACPEGPDPAAQAAAGTGPGAGRPAGRRLRGGLRRKHAAGTDPGAAARRAGQGSRLRAEDVVGGKFVESYGGRVHLAPLCAGFSTTNLIEKMRAA